MQMHSWGRYPKAEARLLKPRSTQQVSDLIFADNSTGPQDVIARGLGRSYGDSALAQTILQMQALDHFISFDESTGQLCCAGGVSLDSILGNFVSRGFCLTVVPGTRFVTVGGAIASDVHGKNHHVDGTFTQHVTELSLLTGTGEILCCSRTQNSELFHATCGGMGLTGIVIDATLTLKPITSSHIIQKTYRAKNLTEIFTLFDTHSTATYSVAWLDCLAKDKQLGRSILYLGEHATEGELKPIKNSNLPLPCDAPSFLLNRFTMSGFNTLYYNKPLREHDTKNIDFGQFFFPLDSISNWNRLYGKKGFIQYQFVVPDESAEVAITTILNATSAAGKGSFLSVLKKFGPENGNWLSFPRQGYTLALDFKWEKNLETLLTKLDSIVLDHGGRLYLAKDARMNENTFKSGYPNWERFAKLRQETGADKLFNSLQSKRLGL
jgi:decaprenylphospho-beta-D-ribofuranose 2-oxidase